ncbi:helix-turn-helix domain-containing protein [Candidatus Woesebacteria bacterium]|nr:helix-turn-helix domain-containing protein [Candidatus Woesebacteria bacterium]
MRTIGERLRKARVRKRLSLGMVEDETKIKRSFIKAIEQGSWNKLPEFPVVLGFVKSLASFLDIEKKEATALLRRDYPLKTLKITPKPDVSSEFVWSPKLTFIVGGFFVFLLVVVYLFFQYIRFVNPPLLTVDTPKDGAFLSQAKIVVSGSTDPNATLKVNNQPVLVEDSGKFSEEIEVLEGENEIEIKAVSRARKETIVKRKIKVEIK